MNLEAIITATAATMLIGSMAYANEVQGKVTHVIHTAKDAEGKARIAEAQRRRWAAYRIPG